VIYRRQKGRECVRDERSARFVGRTIFLQNHSSCSATRADQVAASGARRNLRRAVKLVVCFLGVISAIVPVKAAEQTPKLALLLFSRGFEFMIALDQGARNEASKARADLVVLDGQSNSSVRLQTVQIDELIKQKISAIIISPANSEDIVPAIRHANDANIPVVAVDGIIAPGPSVATFVGFDNAAGGKLAAEYLLKHHAKKILELEGALGAYHAQQRHKGFMEGLAADPNVKVISRPAEWLSDTAQIMTADAFIADPDIDAIFSHNDEMIRGVVTELKRMGKFHKVGEPGHILIVGIDATPLALERIRDGEEDATVQQDPFEMGTLAVQSALAVLAGKQLPAQQLLPPVLVTRENVDTPSLWGNEFKPAQ
jgi:ribose transport system substrate-binding protein